MPWKVAGMKEGFVILVLVRGYVPYVHHLTRHCHFPNGVSNLISGLNHLNSLGTSELELSSKTFDGENCGKSGKRGVSHSLFEVRKVAEIGLAE